VPGPGGDGPLRPRSQILYVYGGFVRRLGGWLAISQLITLMGDLGVESQVVRAAVSRMKSRGLVESANRGGNPGYGLTPRGWRLLEEGDKRILSARVPADLTEGWVLVVFSMPESKREKRHLIRSRLTWLGFGTVAPGVWIAPARLQAEAESAIRDFGLERYSEVFRTAYSELDAARRIVSRSWDLRRLGHLYRAFTRSWQPTLTRWAGQHPPGAKQAFVDYVNLIGAWRKLPYLDPGLPTEVVPAGWDGERATWTYFTLLRRIDQAALDYVRQIAGDS
jgi:phenylacetic acid degradation operon negative regulatory protein